MLVALLRAGIMGAAGPERVVRPSPVCAEDTSMGPLVRQENRQPGMGVGRPREFTGAGSCP